MRAKISDERGYVGWLMNVRDVRNGHEICWQKHTCDKLRLDSPCKKVEHVRGMRIVNTGSSHVE